MIGAGPGEEELRALVTAVGPRLNALAWSLTGHRQDAEDLVQETLVQVVRKWSRVRSSHNQGAYVSSMMANLFLSGRRRASSREVVSDAVVAANVPPTSAHERLEQGQDLVHRVAQLPERQRAVLVLRYLEDFSTEQIAQALSMSPGAVRSTTHRAYEALRTHADGEQATAGRLTAPGA